jgi:adenine C2-methylase RlmN of 23S rRNA A2503 and tRNA A37
VIDFLFFISKFCATGTMGLSGHLTTGEILEQIVHANRILAKEWEELYYKKNDQQTTQQHTTGRHQSNNNRHNNNENRNPLLSTTTTSLLPKIDLIRNVVFMGMGEPLDNYKHVVNACRALIDKKRWNLAHGRVTISTVGIINKMKKLTNELPEINLALSLHAPTQTLRTTIVPTAHRYPIQELINALDDHMMSYLQKRKQRTSRSVTATTSTYTTYTTEERMKESSRRRAMIEYVMLEGPTSTLEAAHQLGQLCAGKQLVVNLIPYNRTDVKDILYCPSYPHMEQFKQIVASYGTFCTIRKTMGADIDSACGQLVTNPYSSSNNIIPTSRNQNKEENEQDRSVPDIEDVTNNILKKTNDPNTVVANSSTTSKNVGSNPMKQIEKNDTIPTTNEDDPSRRNNKNERMQEKITNSRGKRMINPNKDNCDNHNSNRHTPNDDLDIWIRPLMIAMMTTASLFLISSCCVVFMQSSSGGRSSGSRKQ